MRCQKHQLHASNSVIINKEGFIIRILFLLLSLASSYTVSSASTFSHHCWSDSSCWSHDAIQLQCLRACSASLVLLQVSGIKERLASFQFHWLSSARGDVQLWYDDTILICECFYPDKSKHLTVQLLISFNGFVGFLFFQFNRTPKMWLCVRMEGVTTCSSMTVYGPLCTGRRSLQRSGAALGSTKGIRIVALFLIPRSLVTSWRFVSLLHLIRNKLCGTSLFVPLLLPVKHIVSLTPGRV